MTKLRTGVVGVGYLGKFHAEKYACLEEVEFSGVADINPERAESVSARHNVAAYTDHRALFTEVEAVSIAVPTCLHHQIAKDFLTRGIDVLIEKPIAASLKEADELIALAEKNGCILQVGHLERFNPGLVQLDGILKTPLFIETHRLAPFKNRGTDVDVILDIMIHDIDIILSIVASDIVSIHAVGVPVLMPDTNDIANARIEFENGCVANITASRISVKEMRKTRIFQDNTYISIDFAKQQAEVFRKEKSASPDSDIPEISYDLLESHKADQLKNEIASFINCVKLRTPPVVGGRDGRNALKVAFEIVSQVETKKKHMNIS